MTDQQKADARVLLAAGWKLGTVAQAMQCDVRDLLRLRPVTPCRMLSNGQIGS